MLIGIAVSFLDHLARLPHNHDPIKHAGLGGEDKPGFTATTVDRGTTLVTPEISDRNVTLSYVPRFYGLPLRRREVEANMSQSICTKEECDHPRWNAFDVVCDGPANLDVVRFDLFVLLKVAVTTHPETFC